MRCLTITLNPSLDTTYRLDELTVGGTNRARRMRKAAAGKGVNVARVLRRLGHDVTATGVLGGESGRFIEAALIEEGVAARFAWLQDGVSRNCHTIIDGTTGRSTEILEPGPTLTADDCDRFRALLQTLLPGAEAVVLAGSVPEEATPEFLGEIIHSARRFARRLFVDSSGPALQALLAYGPDLIKPNEDEMAMLMGRRATVEDQIAFVQHELIGQQMPEKGQVLLTLGKDGAVLISRESALRARTAAIRPVNTVGCGDALLAGFVESWLAGHGDVTALRNAVACGSAAALCEVAGEVDLADRDRLFAGVNVSLIDRSGASVMLG